MNIFKNHFLMYAGLLLPAVLAGCASTAPETQPAAANDVSRVNDFPTRDRVEYVLNCVAQHGGLTFITQYACGCKIDKIAEKMTFAEYEAAVTNSYLRKTPGEAGGVFRDPKEAKNLRKLLNEADAYAEKQCFVK